MEAQNEPTQQQQSNNGTTSLRTCLNGLNVLAGIGILSIPYTLAEGGWFSLIFLVLMALTSFYTGLLLKRCMDFNPVVKSYPDIGGLAFGIKGRVMVSLFTYLELYLIGVELLIIEGDNLHMLFPNAKAHILGQKIGGKQGFILLTALVILPTTWTKSLGLLSYLSLSGILASVVLVCSVFWVGKFDGVGFHERGRLWNWSGLPNAISSYAFCYSAHVVFPTLCNSMKDTRKFSKVLIISFVLCTINYGSIAVVGYLMYGNNLKSQVTLNLPTKNVSTKVAIFTTVINPITKYPLNIIPIATAIEDNFSIVITRWSSILIRTVIVVTTVGLALIVPNYAYLVAFTGAFFSITNTMLFPCLCYLKIKKAFQKFRVELVMIIIILVMGSFLAVVGTFVSVRDIIYQ